MPTLRHRGETSVALLRQGPGGGIHISIPYRRSSDRPGYVRPRTETPAVGSAVETTFRYAGDAIVAEYTDDSLTREYVTDDAGTISKVVIPGGETGAGSSS